MVFWWNIQVPYRCQEEIDKNDSQDTAFRDNGNYCYCGYCYCYHHYYKATAKFNHFHCLY